MVMAGRVPATPIGHASLWLSLCHMIGVAGTSPAMTAVGWAPTCLCSRGSCHSRRAMTVGCKGRGRASGYRDERRLMVMAGLVPATPIIGHNASLWLPLCHMIGVAGTSPAMTAVGWAPTCLCSRGSPHSRRAMTVGCMRRGRASWPGVRPPRRASVDGHGRACPGHPDNSAQCVPMAATVPHDRGRRDKPGDDGGGLGSNVFMLTRITP